VQCMTMGGAAMAKVEVSLVLRGGVWFVGLWCSIMVVSWL